LEVDMSHRAKPLIRAIEDCRATAVERARGATVRVLIGPQDGAPNFVTRLFEILPGGRIPCHRHDVIEHEQVVLGGAMVIGLEGAEQEVAAGDCLLIPAGVAHWYENRGQSPVRFLCTIPHTDDYQTEWLEPAEDG
jgi:quercetin dioxygenase-like cupin family protein